MLQWAGASRNWAGQAAGVDVAFHAPQRQSLPMNTASLADRPMKEPLQRRRATAPAHTEGCETVDRATAAVARRGWRREGLQMRVKGSESQGAGRAERDRGRTVGSRARGVGRSAARDHQA